jgi:CHAD domain
MRYPPGHEHDEQLHEMRKAAKRLRYATEVATPALDTNAKRMVKRVKAVQELLGEHQDSVVARGLLREMGAAAPAEGGNGFAFGWLLRDEQARTERVEANLNDAYATLRTRAPQGDGLIPNSVQRRTSGLGDKLEHQLGKRGSSRDRLYRREFAGATNIAGATRHPVRRAGGGHRTRRAACLTGRVNTAAPGGEPVVAVTDPRPVRGSRDRRGGRANAHQRRASPPSGYSAQPG